MVNEKMLKVLDAFRDRKLYNHILNDYDNFSKEDLWSIIKELDYAIRETVSKSDYDQIYSYLVEYLPYYPNYDKEI